MSSWNGEIVTEITTTTNKKYFLYCDSIYFRLEEYSFSFSNYSELLIRVVYNYFITKKIISDTEFNSEPQDSQEFLELINKYELKYDHVNDYDTFAAHPIWGKIGLSEDDMPMFVKIFVHSATYGYLTNELYGILVNCLTNELTKLDLCDSNFLALWSYWNAEDSEELVIWPEELEDERMDIISSIDIESITSYEDFIVLIENYILKVKDSYDFNGFIEQFSKYIPDKFLLERNVSLQRFHGKNISIIDIADSEYLEYLLISLKLRGANLSTDFNKGTDILIKRNKQSNNLEKANKWQTEIIPLDEVLYLLYGDNLSEKCKSENLIKMIKKKDSFNLKNSDTHKKELDIVDYEGFNKYKIDFILCPSVKLLTVKQSELLEIICRGDDEGALVLVKSKDDWNFSIDRNINLLHLALMFKCKETALFLIENGIDLNQETEDFYTGKKYFDTEIESGLRAVDIAERLNCHEIVDLLENKNRLTNLEINSQLLFNEVRIVDYNGNETTSLLEPSENTQNWCFLSVRENTDQKNQDKLKSVLSNFEEKTTEIEILAYLITRFFYVYKGIDIHKNSHSINLLLDSLYDEYFTYCTFQTHTIMRKLGFAIMDIDEGISKFIDIYKDSYGIEIFRFEIEQESEDPFDWRFNFVGKSDVLEFYLARNRVEVEGQNNQTVNCEENFIGGYPRRIVEKVKAEYRSDLSFNRILEANILHKAEVKNVDYKLLAMDTLTMFQNGLDPNYIIEENELPFARIFDHPDDTEIFKYFGLNPKTVLDYQPGKTAKLFTVDESLFTIEKYLKALRKLKFLGVQVVLPIELAEFVDTKPHRVEFELSCYNLYSNMKPYIDVSGAIVCFEKVISIRKNPRIILVGSNYIFSTLANYNNNSDKIGELVCIFRENSTKSDFFGDVPIYPINDINKTMPKDISIAFLCVMANIQETVNELINQGITIIINFTHEHIRVPTNFVLIQMDLFGSIEEGLLTNYSLNK